MEQLRNPLDRRILGQPDLGEQLHDVAQQRQAMAFDGKIPVHPCALKNDGTLSIRKMEMFCPLRPSPLVGEVGRRASGGRMKGEEA